MNFANYELYVLDCETTGLDYTKHTPIEISIIRLKDNVQKTWNIKALFPQTIELDALKVNGHLLEDITHKTVAGREKYILPENSVIEIENWLNEDDNNAENRILIGQNVQFDYNMLSYFWRHLDCFDSFPFSYRILDTLQLEFTNDLVNNSINNSYSLKNILKRYGIKNEKAHSAAADVKATAELFIKQIDKLRNK